MSGMLAFTVAFMLAMPEYLADRVPEAEGAAEAVDWSAWLLANVAVVVVIVMGEVRRVDDTYKQ